MAFCANCGKELSPQAVSCPACGHPLAGAPRPIITLPEGKIEGFAIASLACAVANFIFLYGVGAILAVIFGNIAKRKIRETPGLGGEGLARAGIIVGWVGIGVMGVILVIIVLAILAFSTGGF